jgi:CRP-like cAMP-binding protein
MNPGDPKNWNNRHGYVVEFDCTREEEHEIGHCAEGETGFVSKLVPISQSGVGDKYLASFYWVFASMMAVGYGDIFAVTDSERAYSILTQIIGACCFGFIIATVTLLIDSLNPQGKANAQRMSAMSEYASERELPRALTRKLKKHMEHLLQSTSVFDGDKILAELPQELKTKLTNSINADLIERLEITKNCEDSSVVADIMVELLPMSAAPHTQFYAEGDVPLDMYFVAKGKVHTFIMLPITLHQRQQKELEIQHDIEASEHKHDDDMQHQHKHKHGLHMPHIPIPHMPVKSLHDDEENPDPSDPSLVSLELQEVAIGVVEAGHSFGESELLQNCYRQYSVHSSQHSDVLVLTKAKFEKLLFVHAEIARGIAEQSKKHQVALAKVFESETMERFAEDGFHRYSVKTLMMVNGQLRRQEKITNRLFRRASTVVTQTAQERTESGAKIQSSMKNMPLDASERSSSQSDLNGAALGTKNNEKKPGQGAVCLLCLRSRTTVMQEVQAELRKGHVHPAHVQMPSSPSSSPTKDGIGIDGGDTSTPSPSSSPAMVVVESAASASAAAGLLTESGSYADNTQNTGGSTSSTNANANANSNANLDANRPPPVNVPAPVSVPKAGSKRLSLNFGRPAHGSEKVALSGSSSPSSGTDSSPTMDLVGTDRGALSCVGKDDEDAHKYIVMEETTGTMLQRWIINPDDMRKIKWDLLLGAVIMYSVLMIPYRLSFGIEAKGGAEYIDYTCDCLFLLDIFASFRTAYWHSYDSEVLVCVPSAIRNKYLKSWFTVDFLSTVPIDMIFEALLATSSGTPDEGAENGDGSLRSLKLIRVLRLVRLLKLVRLMKLGKNMGHLEEFLDISDSIIKLTKLVGYLFFMAHLIGCFWFFITGDKVEAMQSQDSTKPWWKAVEVGNGTGSQYMASLYWAFTTMTTVGYGDITPTTNTERVYATIMMILGATVFGYIVGNVASLVTAENASGEREKIWNVTAEWIDEQNIAKMQKPRIKQHYDWLWKTHSVFDEQQLFKDIPSVLKNEMINTIHAEYLGKIAIFKQDRFRGDAGFTAFILRLMKPEFCPAGEYIIVPGRTAKCMHFLLQGVAELFEDDLDGEVVKEVLEVGSFFGHEALLSHSKNALGVRAFSACRTYALTKLDIGAIVESHPAIAKKLQDALAVAIRMQHQRLQRKHQIGLGPPKMDLNSVAQTLGVDKSLDRVLDNVGRLTDNFLPGKIRDDVGHNAVTGAVEVAGKNQVVVKSSASMGVKESASMPTLCGSNAGVTDISDAAAAVDLGDCGLVEYTS